MSGFLYFRPLAAGISLAELEADGGLAHAMRGERINKRQTTDGPFGESGCVFNFGEQPAPAFDMAQQDWRRLPHNELGLCVGVDLRQKPKPEQLQRERMLPGGAAADENGDRWRVPAALEWSEHNGERLVFHRLPAMETQNENGEWVRGEIKARYRGLWEAFKAYDAAEAQAIAEGEQLEGGTVSYVLPLEAMRTLTFEAIAVNYHVHACELDLLGVCDREFYRAVCEIVNDEARLRAIQKKTTRAGSSSPSGQGQLTPAE